MSSTGKTFTMDELGGEDAGRYFRYMAEFVGFDQADAEAIRASALIIEKHLPTMVLPEYTELQELFARTFHRANAEQSENIKRLAWFSTEFGLIWQDGVEEQIIFVIRLNWAAGGSDRFTRRN